MQKRRAISGDSDVSASRPKTYGQKIFVLKDDLRCEIFMPIGTRIRFNVRPVISGSHGMGAGKSPSGLLRWKTARISYKRVWIFLGPQSMVSKMVQRMRPVLNTRTERVLLMSVRPYDDLRAKVLSEP